MCLFAYHVISLCLLYTWLIVGLLRDCLLLDMLVLCLLNDILSPPCMEMLAESLTNEFALAGLGSRLNY